MKTYETLKWGKGYYVLTRVNGHAEGREWYGTKTEMNSKVRELKKAGYTEV